ncbi:MAG: hypothetical protein ABFS35_15150 [Bacteroidota bacterium]
MPFVSVLIGCFPNFIAAYIIIIAAVNAVLIKEPKYGRHIIYLTSLLIFVILTVEELRPKWGASTHYDSLDVLASGLGSLLAILTFELITSKRKNRIKK